jgi:hypothetical protein
MSLLETSVIRFYSMAETPYNPTVFFDLLILIQSSLKKAITCQKLHFSAFNWIQFVLSVFVNWNELRLRNNFIWFTELNFNLTPYWTLKSNFNHVMKSVNIFYVLGLNWKVNICFAFLIKVHFNYSRSSREHFTSVEQNDLMFSKIANTLLSFINNYLSYWANRYRFLWYLWTVIEVLNP